MVAIDAALDVVSKYVVALTGRDGDGMNGLRANDFVLDWVHGDAFENRPMSAQEAQMFWPIWFDAFPEFDLEVTRTIAADEMVVTQWIFTGTNTGQLDPPIFEKRVDPIPIHHLTQLAHSKAVLFGTRSGVVPNGSLSPANRMGCASN